MNKFKINDKVLVSVQGVKRPGVVVTIPTSQYGYKSFYRVNLDGVYGADYCLESQLEHHYHPAVAQLEGMLSSAKIEQDEGLDTCLAGHWNALWRAESDGFINGLQAAIRVLKEEQ